MFYLRPVFSGRGAIWAEVFLTAIAEPDAQHLGDLIFFGVGELLVQRESAFAFSSAGLVAVGVPVATGEADEAADLLGEGLAGERSCGVFFGGHGGVGCGGWVGAAVTTETDDGEIRMQSSGCGTIT